VPIGVRPDAVAAMPVGFRSMNWFVVVDDPASRIRARFVMSSFR
jgi:hypothetical protein